jgi:hypothetical protein
VKTKAQVEAFEKIIDRLTGATGFTASRAPPEPPTISDEDWNKMSYHDQKSYAESATAARERAERARR